MGIVDIVVLVLVGLAVFGVAARIIYKKIRGKSTGCGCGSCNGCSGCANRKPKDNTK